MIDDDNQRSEREREGQEFRRWASFARRAARFWPTLLVCVVLAAGASALVLYLMRPAFRSETVILYSQGVGSTDPVEQGSPRNATARLKELLLSRRELSRLVSEFRLYPTIRESYGPDDAVDEFKRHLEFRAPGGDTFSIAFQGDSPQQAQSVTAALAKMVIDGDAKLRKSQTEFARSFLAGEKASKAEVLKEAEQRLAAFMADHRRFALDATPLAAGAAIRATSPGVLPSATPAQPWLSAPRPRAAVVAGQATAPVGADPPPADAGERARAVAALAAARANLAEQLARFTPAHPDVKAAQGALERANARLLALGPEPRAAPVAAAAPPIALPKPEPAPVRTNPGVRPSVAPAERSAPDGREDVVKLETEWLRLTRAVTEARQRLDQIEAALFKADIQASSERTGSGVQISVIDPAYLPQRPLGLSRSVIVAACLAAGFVFGLIAAALRAALDDRILEVHDLERTVPVLVQVPRLGRFHGAG